MDSVFQLELFPFLDAPSQQVYLLNKNPAFSLKSPNNSFLPLKMPGAKAKSSVKMLNVAAKQSQSIKKIDFEGILAFCNKLKTRALGKNGKGKNWTLSRGKI